MPYNAILFGSGASYGSDKSCTPPIGSDLFNALVSFNKSGWGKIPSNLADNFKDDFEEAMRILSNSNPNWIPTLQRAMAAYFFTFTPKESSLYRELARRIIKSNWKKFNII